MKLRPMGVTRKEAYGSPEGKIATSEKNYDKEKVYPEIQVDGKLAEKMGAVDLEDGDRFRQTVEFEVKRHSKTETNGKTSYSMTLCITKGSEHEAVDESDEDEEADDSDDSGEKEEASPAINYIERFSRKD
jgi:hypothetical protein